MTVKEMGLPWKQGGPFFAHQLFCESVFLTPRLLHHSQG
jgi:hypothetical protein